MPLKKVLQKSLRMLSWIIRSVFALHSEWKHTLFGKAQKVAHLCWFLSVYPLFSPFYFVPLHILLKVCDFLGWACLVPGFTWYVWGTPRKRVLECRQHGAWNQTALLKNSNRYGIKPELDSAYLTWKKRPHRAVNLYPPKSTWHHGLIYWQGCYVKAAASWTASSPAAPCVQASQICPHCHLIKPCL